MKKIPAELEARYAVDRELGQGACGVVLLAMHRELNRPVAIKLLHQLDDEMRARFRREAALLAQVRHPRVVQVLDFGADGDTPYLVCELMTGSTLRQYIDEEKPSLAGSLRLVMEVGEALHHVHGLGIVHRDVKPANVFVEERGAVLGDFGFARSLAPGSTVTAPGASVGTPAYMAPEQILGTPTTPRVDQFALGVMAYEMLSGARPFRGTTVMEVLASRLRDPPVPLSKAAPQLPVELANAVMRMIAHEPDRRWPALDAAIDALRPFAGPDGVATREPSRRTGRVRRLAPPPAPTPPPRTRAGGAAVAALSVLAVALAGTWLARPPGARIVRAGLTDHRQAEVLLSSEAPAGARMLVRDGAGFQLAQACPPRAVRVALAGLPEARTLSISLVDERGDPLGEPAALVTPPVALIEDPSVVPTEESIHVAFHNPGPDLTVSMTGPGGRPAGASAVARGRRAFFHLFTELAPGTEYRVRVRGPQGWGGPADWPVTTRGPEYRKRVQSWLRALAAMPLDDAHAFFAHDADPRLAEPIRRKLAAHTGALLSTRQLLWIARDLHDAQLVELLLKHVDDRDPDLLGHAAQAAGSSGHPKAAAIARRAFAQAGDGAQFERSLQALGRTAAPDDSRWLAGALERAPLTAHQIAARAIVARHPDPRPVLASWATTCTGVRELVGLRGLAMLGGAADLERVAARLERPGAARRIAAHALAGTGDTRAAAAIRARFATDPDARADLLWPAVQAGAPGAADVIVDMVRTAATPEARRDALYALALADPQRAVASARDALSGPDDVADAAAFALGRARDATSAKLLLERIAAGRDACGIAAWAVGEVGARDASALLKIHISRMIKSLAEREDPALGPTAWALGKLEDPGTRALLDAALRAQPRAPALAYALACHAAASEPPQPDRSAQLVFAPLPLDRAGLPAVRMDPITVSTEARWGVVTSTGWVPLLKTPAPLRPLYPGPMLLAGGDLEGRRDALFMPHQDGEIWITLSRAELTQSPPTAAPNLRGSALVILRRLRAPAPR